MIFGKSKSHEKTIRRFIRAFSAAYADYVQKCETNNVDKERFDNLSNGCATVTGAGRNRKLLEAYFSNLSSLANAWALLVDDRSKELFIELLCYRLLGHRHVRLSTNTDFHWRARDAAKGLLQSASDLKVRNSKNDAPLRFDFEWRGQPLVFHGWAPNLAWSFFLGQYFFDRGDARIAPASGDHVVDAGACMGDATLAFALAVGESGRVYAFDPLPAHVSAITYNLQANPALYDRGTVLPYALGNLNHGEPLESKLTSLVMDPGFSIKNKSTELPIRSIDRLQQDGVIERIDLLKMDIEGAELDALKGAVRTLEKFRPKLAICIYHRPTDFFEILEFIDGLGFGYEFYIDHYTIHDEETVLYANVPR